MSKEKFDGLEEVQEVSVEATEKTARKRKEQTPEDKATLEAGVELLKEIGVSENLAKVLELVPEWNGDKDTLSVVKEAVIEKFGTSNELKDYIDGAFQEEIIAFQGIAKAMPVLNNIKSFYARRETTGTKKVKTVQVSISGVTYNVNADYRDEISTLPAEDRKELLLSHADTKKADVIEEII